MPPKKRAKKAVTSKKAQGKKEKDPYAKEKKIELKLILEEFDEQVENHLNVMRNNFESTCRNIEILYEVAILNIPAEYHDLTREQYKEKMDAKNSIINKRIDDDISKRFDIKSVMSRFENCKASTAKKKKQKGKRFTSAYSKFQKKVHNDSGNSSGVTRETRTRQALAQMQVTSVTPAKSRGAAKKTSALCTSSVVTPKFDPRRPLISSMLRRPKAGEIVMSMSGSPLLIPAADVPSKPGIVLSLGGGQMINFDNASSFRGIKANLDQSTKHELKLANEKLSRMLAS